MSKKKIMLMSSFTVAAKLTVPMEKVKNTLSVLPFVKQVCEGAISEYAIIDVAIDHKEKNYDKIVMWESGIRLKYNLKMPAAHFRAKALRKFIMLLLFLEGCYVIDFNTLYPYITEILGALTAEPITVELRPDLPSLNERNRIACLSEVNASLSHELAALSVKVHSKENSEHNPNAQIWGLDIQRNVTIHQSLIKKFHTYSLHQLHHFMRGVAQLNVLKKSSLNNKSINPTSFPMMLAGVTSIHGCTGLCNLRVLPFGVLMFLILYAISNHLAKSESLKLAEPSEESPKILPIERSIAYRILNTAGSFYSSSAILVDLPVPMSCISAEVKKFFVSNGVYTIDPLGETHYLLHLLISANPYLSKRIVLPNTKAAALSNAYESAVLDGKYSIEKCNNVKEFKSINSIYSSASQCKMSFGKKRQGERCLILPISKLHSIAITKLTINPSKENVFLSLCMAYHRVMVS